MLNIDSLEKGVVIDHIESGKSMEIYRVLELDKLDCSVAIIKNARSKKSGRKDITVNIIDGGHIIEKKHLQLPERIVNVAKCKNPRCITSVEQELDHVFVLTDPEKGVYRCMYCEQEYKRG